MSFTLQLCYYHYNIYITRLQENYGKCKKIEQRKNVSRETFWSRKWKSSYKNIPDIIKRSVLMLEIKLADRNDYTEIRDFYYTLIDAMVDSEYNPGWEKDIYPTQEYLLGSIENKELYIGKLQNQIASCMIVNHKYNDGYKKINWSVDAKDPELYVIHVLGVAPVFSGKGITKEMVGQVIKIAKEKNMKTVRLDVLEGNLPAERAYTKMGFQYIDTIKMFYEDTGWTNYKVYEFIV